MRRRHNPFEACFAPAQRFGRSNISCATIGYVPPAGAKLKSFPNLPSNQAWSCSSIMSEMRNVFLALSGAGVGILQSASARVAEYFCQLLAPVVEISPFGDLSGIPGIGTRLVRDGRAIPDNENVAARTRRLDQLHGASDALRLLRWHRAWP